MGNLKELLSRYGFATLLILLGIIFLIWAASTGQNTWVMLGIFTVIAASGLIAFHNSGALPLKLTSIFVAILILSSLTYAWFDYSSIHNII